MRRPPPLQFAVLVYLAWRGDYAISANELAALFWGELPESRAKRCLSQCLYALRRSLLLPIDVASGTVVLKPSSIFVDAKAFLVLVAAGKLRDAAAMHSGTFLAHLRLRGKRDFRFWHDRVAADIASKACRVMSQLAVEADAAGNWDEVEYYTTRYLELNPDNGDFATLRAQARAASGDLAGALASLKGLRGRGTGFARKVRLAYQAIDRSNARYGVPSGSTSQPQHSPFVGRGDEFRLLRSAWESMLREGSFCVTQLEGEPGIGKSRLIDQFARWAAIRGGRVILGDAAN